jgi:serine/threonine-protein kinase HipA
MTAAGGSAIVSLSSVDVATLERFDDGDLFELKFNDDFRRQPVARRPVLGQFYEDRLLATVRTESFPAWFANALPERGPYRASIARALELDVNDHWALLLALGNDLPGAVTVRATSTKAPRQPRASETAPQPPPALGVSLAGVQAKLSIHDDDDGKLVVPVAAGEGQAIVKFHDPDHARIVQVEYATTMWARAAGVVVPDVRLVETHTIEGLPEKLFDLGDGKAFLTRRFDRDGERRIHMEDFAQLFDRPPAEKYDEDRRPLHYEELGAVIAGLCDDNAFMQFLEQLVFCVVCGNTDAHLKNFSVLYPDGRTPVLSPAYDLVAAVVYERHAKELALRLGGTKELAAVDAASFEGLCRFACVASDARDRVREAAQRARDAFREVRGLFSSGELGRIEAHLSTLKL